MYVLLSILCVLGFCIILFIVSPQVHSCLLFLYKFTDHCHRVETRMQLTNISHHIIYHIKSYHIIQLDSTNKYLRRFYKSWNWRRFNGDESVRIKVTFTPEQATKLIIWWNTSRCALIVLINKNTGTSGTTTFIVYICGLHVSTYTQVTFRPSCTRKSIKGYARWDPIVLTSLKYISYIRCLCLSINWQT